MISHKFLNNPKVLYVTYQGKIALSEMVNYISSLQQVNFAQGQVSLLHDLHKADFVLKTSEIAQVVQAFESFSASHEEVRVAAVHKTPHSTAISTIIRERIQARNLDYRVYSTIDAAMEWLKIQS